MADVKVKLLRPLDGKEAGATATYSQADAQRLASYGAVEIVQEKAKPAAQNKMEAAPANKSSAASFDHDGDGKVGGAPKGGNRKRKA